MPLTLGSLFDGAGGFPLAAKTVGIKPRWASEIEPFPTLITTKKLPHVKHLGDVTKIDGAKIEPVDIITFGSPCQNFSEASGKQTGLAGEKSSLFFEAIRIIKEMRAATNNKFPRYAIWENVTGAITSHKGKDFGTVLTEIAKISEPYAPNINNPEQKWRTAGILLAEKSSIAWRVLNSQFFGVPQQRRRVFVIADFRGKTAPTILFEPYSVQGQARKSKTTKQDNPPHTVSSIRKNHKPKAKPIKVNKLINPGGVYGVETDIAPTIETQGIHPGRNFTGIVIIEPDENNNLTRPRRLTPKECQRLQGFPENYVDNLNTPKPTPEQVKHWRNIWHHWNKINETTPRADSHIIKWLQHPTSDIALYKLWGNSVAIPVVEHILKQLNNTHND